MVFFSFLIAEQTKNSFSFAFLIFFVSLFPYNCGVFFSSILTMFPFLPTTFDAFPLVFYYFYSSF